MKSFVEGTSEVVKRRRQYGVQFPDGQVAGISFDLKTSTLHLAAFDMASLDNRKYAGGEIVARDVETVVVRGEWGRLQKDDRMELDS